VCDEANETCPVFPGKVRNRLHIGFEDPSKTKGSYTEIINSFYDVRNEIRDEFYELFETELRKKL
jgi:arsenate reductase